METVITRNELFIRTEAAPFLIIYCRNGPSISQNKFDVSRQAMLIIQSVY